MAKLVEVVYNLDEFKAKVDNSKAIHYELWNKPLMIVGAVPLRMQAGIILYGVSKDGQVLQCVLRKSITIEELNKRESVSFNVFEDYNAWIKEVWSEFEALAKDLNATKGKWIER